MRPEIDFQHVLSELSVNRFDPCEVVRELISNAYDAQATSIHFAPALDESGFIFADNGIGLDRLSQINGITPYSAFFSIGKSTKRRGDGGIGYKCQGSKLCFACSRILILTRCKTDDFWWIKIIDNPRQNLSPTFDIEPTSTKTPWSELETFFGGNSAKTHELLSQFDQAFFESGLDHGTLIAVSGFDVDNFSRFFYAGEDAAASYIYNYIRHYTRHGDTRFITKSQGFSASHVLQAAKGVQKAEFKLWTQAAFAEIPFGFSYLDTDATEALSPADISRLRDGRFSARAAKRTTVAGKSYVFVLSVDGNRRAHDGYRYLDRKGGPRSGIRLSDQRGVWMSASGIKVARQNDLLYRSELEDYEVLAEGDALNHYQLVIDGDFELVTNRNGLSRSASTVLENSAFIAELRGFLDNARSTLPVFSELLKRLRREQTDARLNEQIEILDASKSQMSLRERFEIADCLYVSPRPGEEYLVGVLYAALGNKVDSSNAEAKHWKHVLTFSTQGIDSLATLSPKSLKNEDLVSVEYKYEFSNAGPFNHALSIVNFVVAWEVNFSESGSIQDQYGCYGTIVNVSSGVWRIHDVNHKNGDSYGNHEITVICLRTLIERTFPETKFKQPPPPLHPKA